MYIVDPLNLMCSCHLVRAFLCNIVNIIVDSSSFRNGCFIGLALVVPTLDLIAVSVGSVAGFSNYNAEYPL